MEESKHTVGIHQCPTLWKSLEEDKTIKADEGWGGPLVTCEGSLLIYHQLLSSRQATAP